VEGIKPMKDLQFEIDQLQEVLDETNRKLVFKTIAKNLLDQIDEMIKIHRQSIITPDSAALVTTCTQLRALLLSEEVGKLKND
jgi:2-phospho-L-lactate guanylyltransferase (CobY/MobA/RfbA family)